MFDQLVVSSSGRRREQRWRYFTATAIVWVAALTVVIVGGVVAYEGSLGDLSDITRIDMRQAPPDRGNQSNRAATKQKATGKTVPQPEKMVSHQESPDEFDDHPTTAPVVPDSAASDSDNGPGAANPGSGGEGTTPGVEGGNGKQPETTARVEQPQLEKTREEQPQRQLEPVRKSGGVFQGSAVRRLSPIYPHLTRVSRTSGSVVVEVIVDEFGNVTAARALSGHPLLREAAVAAARRWRWNPTLLTGVPVQVVGTITFNFTL